MINTTFIYIEKLKKQKEKITDKKIIEDIDKCIERISITGITLYDIKQISKLLSYKK